MTTEKTISKEILERSLPHTDISQVWGAANESGVYLKGVSDIRSVRHDWWRLNAIADDPSLASTEPGCWVPNEHFLCRDARSPSTLENGGLPLVATAFGLCDRLHRQAFEEKRKPFWFTYDVAPMGIRAHVRGGLGPDVSHHVRNGFRTPEGDVRLLAVAACHGLAWPVGGVDPQADSPVPYGWYTVVHLLELEDLGGMTDGPDPLGWGRPDEVPPPYFECTKGLERMLLRRYGLDPEYKVDGPPADTERTDGE